MQKLLNKITYYFLSRAFTQMQNELENEDAIAQFLEEYYEEFVN